MLANPGDLFVREYVAKPKFFDSKGEPNRFLGVELEIGGMNEESVSKLKKCAAKWRMSIHADGSIPNSGFEINTSPAKGEAFNEQINEVCDILKEGEAWVDNSCGLHVHVDARDLSADDIFKTLIIWRKIEKKMFGLCKRGRARSEWCRSMKKSFNHYVNLPRWEKQPVFKAKTNIFEKQIQMLKQRAKFLHNLIEEGDKYTAINFIHLSNGDYGTVENRMHEGTIDKNKILKWAKTNSKLFDLVKNISLKDAKKMTATQLMNNIQVK
jgi:hypothetical protein